MTGSRLLTRLIPAIFVIALAVPASASAQATRTWVSGVGDDANPCSRTAPCKTFAGAISKTATKGEINCLDPGGFGGVTITKAISIRCHYTEGGVLVSGTNAIVVNAPADAQVNLQGLDINGLGTGLNGVRVLAARAVRIIDSQIYGFVRNAVNLEPSNANFKGLVSNTIIENNTGNGVMLVPNGAAATGARATVKNSFIQNNGCGVTAASFIPDAAFAFGTDCGISNNVGSNQSEVNTINTTIVDNNFSGVFSKGGVAFNRITNNEVIGNANGLRIVSGGNILSFGGNLVDANGVNGAPTNTIPKVKRQAKGRV
jgi:hypothetical protein